MRCCELLCRSLRCSCHCSRQPGSAPSRRARQPDRPPAAAPRRRRSLHGRPTSARRGRAHSRALKASDDRAPPRCPASFEVRRGADIVYMTATASTYSPAICTRSRRTSNLTEARRRELRLALINAVPESQMVVFSPPQPEVHRHGVHRRRLRLLPRAASADRRIQPARRAGALHVLSRAPGPNTESWSKAEQVWCSADRKAALTRAKLGEALDVQAAAAPTRWRANTRSARRSASRARPGSSPPMAPCWAAICRPMRWSQAAAAGSPDAQ